MCIVGHCKCHKGEEASSKQEDDAVGECRCFLSIHIDVERANSLLFTREVQMHLILVHHVGVDEGEESEDESEGWGGGNDEIERLR